MRKTILFTVAFVVAGAPLSAQSTATSEMNITLDDAERRALDRNPRIAEARLATDAADYAVAESRTAFTPNLSLSMVQRSQTNASTSQLAGGQGAVTNDTLNYTTGISQQLKWGGGRYSVEFNSNRAATSNLFATLNPSFTSGVSASFTQPLLKGFRFDAPRAQVRIADINRSIADVQVRQEAATTLHSVRRAYWELVYAVDALDTARRSEALARRNLEENRLRVQLGTLAPIDVVQSEAEIASRHQSTVQAEGAWRDAQVSLKQLIVKDTSDPVWATTLVPVERPSRQAQAIDLPAAIARAIAGRTDLDIARKQQQSADVSLQLANEERKPGVDLVASYSATGVGGTRVLRSTDALGGTVIGTVPGSYLDALGSLAGLNYPTWSVGVNVSLPLGKKAADAVYARGVVEKRQSDLRIEALQLQVAADVTRSAEAVRTAEEAVQAAGSARQLAQKRLDAETARRDAGLSTTFLVLQAQRDLATAETAELRARLDYRTTLAEFDRVQTAP
jgi:HAE1 family hydrophobic/amphiphilic exporter-1